MEDEIVYNGWLKVLKRHVKNKEYDILKDYDAVCAIVINQFNEVLMVKQFRPALMEETIELPAGSLDVEGEHEISCLIRELKEETGLFISDSMISFALSYKPMMGFSNSLMKVYLVKVEKEELKSNEIEDEDVYQVFWMDFKEWGDKIRKGEILDIKAILAYFYLKDYLENNV